MTVMQWNDQLDVAVEAMNDEHRGLLDWMNKLHDRAAAGTGKAEIVMLAQQLESSARKHFRSEEAYMASIGFPGLRTHKNIHDTLLATLAAHIQGIDAKYGPRGKPAAAQVDQARAGMAGRQAA